MTITLGSPTLDREGRPGVVARITTDSGGWHGVYHLATHGMSAEKVAAERDRIEAWHGRKAAKLGELAAMIGGTIHDFTFTDATVIDRGHGCEVVCRARSGAKVIEYREFFDDPAHVPAIDAMWAEMNDRIKTYEGSVDDALDYHASVTAALGLGMS